MRFVEFTTWFEIVQHEADSLNRWCGPVLRESRFHYLRTVLMETSEQVNRLRLDGETALEKLGLNALCRFPHRCSRPGVYRRGNSQQTCAQRNLPISMRWSGLTDHASIVVKSWPLVSPVRDSRPRRPFALENPLDPQDQMLESGFRQSIRSGSRGDDKYSLSF